MHCRRVGLLAADDEDCRAVLRDRTPHVSTRVISTPPSFHKVIACGGLTDIPDRHRNLKGFE